MGVPRRYVAEELLFRMRVLEPVFKAIGCEMFVGVPMNYSDAIGVFFALMESKPCWQQQSEVWPERGE